MPKVAYNSGIFTCFSYKPSFVKFHYGDCCRFLAVYCIFLLGHDPSSKTYTVHYNPNTNEVAVVSLKKLLFNVFYKNTSYGSI